MRTAALLGALVAAVACHAPASAAMLVFEAHGHKFEFEQERNDAGDVVLKVDGTLKVETGAIYFERFDRLGDVDYFVGLAGTGGNACDAAPFIVSIPRGGIAKLFGPVESCAGVGLEYLDDRIVMREGGLPGADVNVWTWTPTDGISRVSEKLGTDAGKGWATLWDRKVGHPSELLFNGEVTKTLEATAGDDWAEVRKQYDGLAEAKFVGDFFVSSSCVKEDCLQAGQFTALDLQTKSAFVALKPRGGKVRVHPAVKEWPATARQGLKEWASQF
jgi:hypothetical protein